MNPSWEITKSLPPFLPRSDSTNPSDPAVRILIHPEPIHVCYNTVRDLVPRLWSSHKKIDYALHIGMASGRKFYSIERRGHRDGYGMRDVDGELLRDFERRMREGHDWIWDGLPEELESCFDVDDVWKRWRGSLPVRQPIHM